MKNTYKEKAKAINDAINLLIQYNYIVIDLENKWIKKNNNKK